ncbi:hypothetical protein EST38_g12169 [Candolleomyces aberdarensis]|uniref:Nephrocystin 3-like N-terminal domain-containing protein n=1 Tax=Candolleomyces aberdarensis TaxID=2316362 RepID=A0A4Q2D685_9AGAR|nr:hypothetical protein EST38_g12169 [Candolleomyces aberdarensis]
MATYLPETAPLIEAAVKAEPQLLRAAESSFSLGARLQRLVYEPFKAVAARASLTRSFLSNPYLIIIDGLDECDDKEGVQEVIDTTLRFFKQNPSVPLRIYISSRVEQHIHSALASKGGVRLKDLANHCSRDDIETFMRNVFGAQAKANPVIRAYISQHGPWPSPSDAKKLVDHIGGSFIFASTLFKFIFTTAGQGDRSTPMDRLPLALNISPGLDVLYSQVFARAEDLPHFTNVISVITLLASPLPVSAIAELLDIQAYEVVHVLLELQAIIQVPGTDHTPVTLCHSSLRDFLTTEGRSGRFFVPPSFHARLVIDCLSCELKARRKMPTVNVLKLEFVTQTVAVQYSLIYGHSTHWYHGEPFFTATELGRLLQLRREVLEVVTFHEMAESINLVAIVLHSLFGYDRSKATIEEAISLHRQFTL